MVKSIKKRNTSRNISKKKQYGGLQETQIVALGNTGIILKPTPFTTQVQVEEGPKTIVLF